VKLPGWIKSAVEFVRVPAGRPPVAPPEAPPADAPHEIESRAPPQDADAGDIETAPEAGIEAAPASRTSIESESPISARPERPINAESNGSPNQQEIDRRRGLVRKFFNDYWSSADDKPSSFAERLDRAEGYINERAAAGGEAWRLGPATRKQLGLPPSKKSERSQF
jgi:hypothetical protein